MYPCFAGLNWDCDFPCTGPSGGFNISFGSVMDSESLATSIILTSIALHTTSTAITSPPTNAAVTSASSVASTTPTSTPTPTPNSPPPSTSSMIKLIALGAGIGVPLTLILLAALIFLYRERKLNQRLLRAYSELKSVPLLKTQNPDGHEPHGKWAPPMQELLPPTRRLAELPSPTSIWEMGPG
ncbi:hypothetical protein MMC18_000444 [Xylographa bjoerkii]|nr:hypothetical protein [Xylographa bjoerkii]